MPGKVKLLPYCEMGDKWTLTEPQVKALYDKIVRDGLQEIVFMHGDIPDAEAFFHEMTNGGSFLFVVYAGTLQAGVIWLNRIEGKTCRVHFTSFSESWGMDTVQVGRDGIRQIMYMTDPTGEFTWDALLGLTPSWNVRALRWLEKVGLKRVGEIPSCMWDDKAHESVDGTLMYLTR